MTAWAVALNQICPMHLIVSPGGDILNAGPTLRRVVPEMDQITSLFDGFEVVKPWSARNIDQLSQLAGQKLSIKCVAMPDIVFTGLTVPVGEYWLINLSFGLGVVDAVRRFDLTAKDFAPTDLSIGMIYLAEAKTIAMDELTRLNQHLHGAKSQAEKAANTDALTGLSNLRALRDELNRLQRNGTRFAVMTLDLDHFKAVNDTLGHAAGDHVLQVTSRILREETRKNDVVARNGGDEFTILLKEIDKAAALDVARRIIDRLEQPIDFEGATCRISASIGTIFAPAGDDKNVSDLLNDADRALYSSKRAGRGRNTVFG